MTLPEFFDRLIQLTRESNITETFGGHLQYDRKTWIIDNLQMLKKHSETDPQFWGYQGSTNRSLWHGSLPFLVDHGLFAEFQGDKVLKKKLRTFLGV